MVSARVLGRRLTVREALLDRLSTEARWLAQSVVAEWVASDHGWTPAYVGLVLRRLVREGAVRERFLRADDEPMVRCDDWSGAS